MSTSKSATSTAVIYGAISGGVMIVISLILFAANLTSPYYRYIDYLILAAGIFIGTKSYRDKSLEGYMTYGNALGTGTLVAVFAGVVFTIYSYIYITKIDPGMVARQIQMSQNRMINRGMTDEQIQMAMKMTKKFMSPGIMTLFTLLGTILMGFIISLITSAFIKKEKPVEATLDEDIE